MKRATKPAAQRKITAERPYQPTLHQTFVMTNRNGLHARPCALLVRTLRPFACTVEVVASGMVANGQSILGLMSLAVAYGSRLTFIINGSQAARAMSSVQQLFQRQFEETYAAESRVTAA